MNSLHYYRFHSDLFWTSKIPILATFYTYLYKNLSLQLFKFLMAYLCLTMEILKKYRKFLSLFGVISIIILSLFYNALLPDAKLPIYQPAMVNFELVDSTIQHQKKFHRIADFSLTNQNGKIISHQDYKGKIYVADFFFTTCPTICIAMTDNLIKVQEEIKNNPNICLLYTSPSPRDS